MKLRALKEVWYAGRTRMPGDEFECVDNDFILIHTAKDAYGGPKAEKVIAEAKAPTPYRTTELKLETPQPVKAETVTTSDDTAPPTDRRSYRRRDMRSER